MSKRFSKVGWQQFVASDYTDLVKQCSAKKDALLTEVSAVVSKEIGTSFETYSPDRLKEFGLLKSILRGLLRYDGDVKRLGYRVATQVAGELSADKDNLYCTPPYPYLHFPHDSSESSVLHIDEEEYRGEFFTAWLPLQACTDKPITVVPRSHRKLHANRVLSWIERKARLPTLPWFYPRKVSPDVELGEFLAWTGKTHHSGNLNQSDRPRVVLNFRMSTEPELLEPTCQIRDLKEAAAATPVDTPSPTAYAKKYLQVFKAIETARLFQANAQAPLGAVVDKADALIKSWKLSPMDRKRVAFGLALGTMRRKNQDPDVAALNLVAALTEPEYMWPLNSFVEYAMAHFPAADVAALLSGYGRRYPSAQVAHVLGKLEKQYPALGTVAKPSAGAVQFIRWN